MTDFTKIYHQKAYDTISTTSPALSQNGRTVLITGGGSGIGFSIAEAFATAGAAHVVILGRNLDTLKKATTVLKGKLGVDNACSFGAYSCDVNDPSSIAAVWAELAKHETPIDTLVLNAAVSGPATDVTHAISFFTTNIVGNMLMFDNFKKQGRAGKVLINISTFGAHWSPSPMPEVTASKAGIASLFQSCADRVDVKEMLMVNIHPGLIFTEGAKERGFAENSVPWDDVELSASFCVWVSKQAFLHGRFVWANWDAEELVAMQDDILRDKGMLRIGLQGVEPVSPATLFAKIAEKRSR